jgi:RNA polymerase sigma factor (sigma-70 family)
MTQAFFQNSILPLQHKLYRFALRITGHTQEAEDVVQEVLEKVWSSSETQTSAVQNWEAWCMTLTRNKSLDKSRAFTNRRTAPLDGLQERPAAVPNPAQGAEASDTVAQIKKLMQQLPEKQRLVMHLRDVEEHTYEEIAEVLNISLDDVKINLHRARKKLRDYWMKHEQHAIE